MIGHGFKSLFMVASVAGAALGCYLVSLNVASERAKLESVEGKIVTTQNDIRLLQTEIGTRGRLAQLERWNAGFIRLSAPTADQFLEGGFQLATMVKPAPKSVIGAPVVLASVPVEPHPARPATTDEADDAGVPLTPEREPVAQPRPAPSAGDMMRVASYERPVAEPKPPAIAPHKPAAPKAPTTKVMKTAAVDGLAPLPAAKPAPKKAAATATKTKDVGTPR